MCELRLIRLFNASLASNIVSAVAWNTRNAEVFLGRKAGGGQSAIARLCCFLLGDRLLLRLSPSCRYVVVKVLYLPTEPLARSVPGKDILVAS